MRFDGTRTQRFLMASVEEIRNALAEHEGRLAMAEAVPEVDNDLDGWEPIDLTPLTFDEEQSAVKIETVADEILELMDLEINRFGQPVRCSKGGLPVEYVDHFVHLRDRRTIRQIAEEETYDLRTPRV